MNTHFKTPYNRVLFPGVKEKNNLPSETVPDQSMSVQEIMNRYAKGLPLGGGKVEIYNGEDDDFPDMERLDLAERQEVYEEAQKELDQLRKKVQTNKQKQQVKLVKKNPPEKTIKEEELTLSEAEGGGEKKAVGPEKRKPIGTNYP